MEKKQKNRYKQFFSESVNGLKLFNIFFCLFVEHYHSDYVYASQSHNVNKKLVYGNNSHLFLLQQQKCDFMS